MKFPLKHYRQIWSQLVIQNDTIYHKVKSPTMEEDRLLIIPQLQQESFLQMAHEQSGHKGVDRMPARLSQLAYWIRMSHAVICHCRYCRRCQVAKAPKIKQCPTAFHRQLPLGNGHSGHPQGRDQSWTSTLKGNQYILVAQEYFSNGPLHKPSKTRRLTR